MKNLILAATSILLPIFLGSCDDSGVNPAMIGSKRCDVHQRECLEEEVEIIVSHGPLYTEEVWELLYSEEYIQAKKKLFPNTNGDYAYNPEGERGKKFRRFYCPECREQETKWLAQNNKKEAEQAAPSNR